MKKESSRFEPYLTKKEQREKNAREREERKLAIERLKEEHKEARQYAKDLRETWNTFYYLKQYKPSLN